MGTGARLRGWSVLAFLILCLVGAAPRATAEDAFVLNRPLPKLESLLPRTQRQAITPARRFVIASAPAVTAVDPVCDIFANGYDVPGAKPCATCFDGVTDWDETDTDCGGAWCTACADGKHCLANNDCVSSLCNPGPLTCSPATCLNGMQDGGETDVDCGGPCPTCTNGLKCLANSDCTSGACDFLSGVCVASLCLDQRKDGSETDIDCGGPACPTCANGKLCFFNSDCTEGWCRAGTCANPVCNGVGCVYCDPTNPQPICGTDSHCIPQPDTTSVCSFPAGAGTSGAFCSTDADCAGPLACVGSGSTFACQAWCAYSPITNTCPGIQTCTELNPAVYTGSSEWGVCI
jgi:hypothetical protein